MTDKKEDFRHSKKFSRFLHDEEQRLKSSVIKIFGVFFLILIGLNSYQLLALSNDFRNVKQYNQGVVDEVGQMKGALVNFGNDLNEIRSYLYLPTREYFLPEEGEEPTDEGAREGSQMNQALYKLLTDTAESNKREAAFANHCNLIESLHKSETFGGQMGQEELILNELSKTDALCSFKLSKGETALYNLVASQMNPSGILIQSALGEQQMTLSEDAGQKITDYLKNNVQKVLDLKEHLENQKAALGALLASENIKKRLAENQLTVIGESTENQGYFSYPITNAQQEPAGELRIDRKTGYYHLGEESYKTASSLEKGLMEYLSDLERAPASTMNKRAELEAIFKEKAFQGLLKENEFTLNHSPRQEENRLIYEIKDEEDQVVMSIILDVGSGETLVKRGNEELDLLSILHPAGEEKKNLELPEVLPDFGDAPKQDQALTILVAGKHGSLVDTMMVVRLADGKISVVSVPRDLYWNGRKINSVYALYGMQELVRVLSQISGYQIDHYALIDMYAFIEVVDLIGCLDVTLEETLVDPTYKTLDNGVWGTLYYPAGTHHLCGKQALRVARSRHTSSDFSRAERQHIVLEALKNKAGEIGLKDAGKLKELAQTTLKYTETDLNPAQALAYYFRFKDFKMNRGHVLSSGNVLESTYSGDLNGSSARTCTTNEETGEETCTGGNRGAYILLPRNGNWNNIKWFFQQAFEKGGEDL